MTEDQASSNSIEGFYRGYLTGAEGNGFALFVFQDGKLVGADPLGVKFDGTYVKDERRKRYRGSVTVTAPPNGTLVQGVTTGPSGLTYAVKLDLPFDFESDPFIQLATPLGPVNLRIEKLRSIR